MFILGIDTATLVCTVGVAQSDKIIAEYSLNIKKTHSQRLMPLIVNILKDCGIDKKELGAISVARGPGSFTGIRIGMATAKTLGQALGIPVVGIPTLDSLAMNFSVYNTNLICPILDARRNQVYTAIYRSLEGNIKRESDYLAISINELMNSLQEKEEKVFFLGDGVPVYREIIKDIMADQAIIAPPGLRQNRGALVAMLAFEKLKDNTDHHEGCFNLSPLYIRKPEAEIKLAEKPL